MKSISHTLCPREDVFPPNKVATFNTLGSALHDEYFPVPCHNSTYNAFLLHAI